MAHLVQFFLPRENDDGAPFARSLFDAVKHELAERFGGVTAFTQAPAEGLWADGPSTDRDRVFVFEVVAQEFEAGWWRAYRRQLERRFGQDSVLMRVWPIELI
jgi:hypothetical protein